MESLQPIKSRQKSSKPTDYASYADYKDSGVPWLGEIPSHWEVKKKKYLFRFSRGLTITKANLLDEGIPCVNYGEVHSKFGFEVNPEIHPLKCVSQEYLETHSYALLKHGDFVYADTSEDYEGSGNFTYLNSDIKTFAGYHTVVERQIYNHSPRFFAYIFDSDCFRTQVKNLVSGVKVFSITHGILKNSFVWLPPQAEQQTIVDFLDSKLEHIDSLISKQQQLIKKLAEQRTAVITHAVTKGLNPNALMKDSGVEWLGGVPEGWDVKRLKSIADFFKGFAFKSVDFSSADGVYLIKASNVKKHSITNVETLISSKKIIPSFDKVRLKKGDIILSTVGSLPKVKNSAVGQIAIVNEKYHNSFLNQNNVCFRARNETGYLSWVVKSDYFRNYLNLNALWIANQAYLEVADINNIFCPKPPIKEQQAIVQHLDQEIDKIDNMTKATKDIISKLQEYRSALITQAVTGKIDVSNINITDKEDSRS